MSEDPPPDCATSRELRAHSKRLAERSRRLRAHIQKLLVELRHTRGG